MTLIADLSETTAPLRAALATVKRGVNVAYIAGSPREAQLARALCAELSNPDPRFKGGRSLRYNYRVIRFCDLTAGPIQIAGFGGQVIFDGRLEDYLRAQRDHGDLRADEFLDLAERCNARASEVENTHG